jgi:hypothetical protein
MVLQGAKAEMGMMYQAAAGMMKAARRSIWRAE